MKLDNLITEMPRNYSYPPDATPEQKKAIKAKVETNIFSSIKKVRDFQKKIEDLRKEWDVITQEEIASIRDEGTTRFGPLQQLHRVTSALGDIMVITDKAITKVRNSHK